MTESRPLLAIVPARGGSKGVPHKNFRLIGDKPLVAYTLETVSAAGVADRLLVSSDDDHVLRWTELHGYATRRRSAALANDEATISEVAADIADELDWTGDVAVFQPTSPFRSSESVVAAVERFRESGADSLASCVREQHAFWLEENGTLASARPLFDKRVNRQYAQHRVLRETGSIQLVRAAALRSGREMVTNRHVLFETKPEESLDIDTNDDLVIARRRFEQGTVVFRLLANRKVGSGHIYHCLQLADELADQRLEFLLKDCDPFVHDLIDEHGYPHRAENDLATDIAELSNGGGPRVIVNDVLDTSEHDVLIERAAGFRVVNVEDLGAGARLADWVVNALYPLNGDAPHANVATGAAYATLRGEFLALPRKEIRRVPERLLISFGGTDPGNLALRCAHVLAREVDADVRVVVGPGATDKGFPEGVVVKRHVRSMAAEMMEADVVLTSAGRTVYEAAAVGTPVAVLAQAARDATHSHLGMHSGVVFLGIGPLTDDTHVLGVVKRMLGDYELRAELSERLRCSIDSLGAARIGHQIRAMLKGL